MVTSDMVNVKVMKTKTAVEEIRRSMQTIQQSKLLDITNVNYLSSKMSMYFTYHIFECIAFIGLCFGQIYLIKKLFGNSSILWWILNDVKYVMYIIILFIISFLFSFWLFFLFFFIYLFISIPEGFNTWDFGFGILQCSWNSNWKNVHKLHIEFVTEINVNC